ncbi:MULTISPECIES: pilin [unclassified Psychrobacter]|uniref:pilin n=1 Tax=unclassified Psychrobacter TaxID=196806 RepID=UPI00384B4B97
MLFIETDSPPPFYQEQLTPAKRTQLDKWFIGHRSQHYYLKRFEQFDAQGYLSPKWHWAAFFVTFPWLLYRKRYMDAIVYSVAGWSFIQLNVALVLVAFEFLAMSFIPDAYQMATRIGIAAIIWLFWSFMVARWTDAYYYRMARREIADAIDDYPRDEAAQKVHLRREGGVSLFGLGLGFGIFAFALIVIKIQFLPIIAKPKANEVLFDAYDIAKTAQNRVALIYQQTGQCPMDLPIDTGTQQIRIDIDKEAAGVVETDCAVIATIQNVQFPIRYLNQQTLVFYHVPDSDSWNCTSSLNKKLAPASCMPD